MEQIEIWKPVVGFETFAKVSNWGRIRTIDRIVHKSNGHTQYIRGKLLKGSEHTPGGYIKVSLDSKRLYVHRLIAQTFIPNPNNLPEIDHINGIRSDNSVTNLRWVTRADNVRNPITFEKMLIKAKDPLRIQNISDTRIKRRRKCAPKVVYQFTIDGAFIAEFSSCHEAARITGISYVSISTVARGGKHKKNEKSAGGYLWSYDRDNPPKYPFPESIDRYRRIYQYDAQYNLIKVWNFAKEAASDLGISSETILKCAKGLKHSKYKGFWWKFGPLP